MERALDIRITLEDDPPAADRALVDAGLRAYNVRHAGEAERAAVTVFARTAAGDVVGGLFGEMHWRWLYVDTLWVADEWRGRGIGSQLLQRAEAEARRRGSQAVGLDTFEFQARGFYERHGYTVYGVLEGFPPGSRKYYLRKSLVTPAPAA